MTSDIFIIFFFRVSKECGQFFSVVLPMDTSAVFGRFVNTAVQSFVGRQPGGFYLQQIVGFQLQTIVENQPWLSGLW